MSRLHENSSPSLYDYLAASMITIATVWLWAQASIHLPQFFEGAPIPLVTAASYGFYTLGGAAASYLVLNKTGNREVMTGLKVGAFTSAASALYYHIRPGVQPNLALIVSFLAGGYVGALIRIKQVTRRIIALPADVGEELEEDDASGS